MTCRVGEGRWRATATASEFQTRTAPTSLCSARPIHRGTPPVPAASNRACATGEKPRAEQDERSGAEVLSRTPERRRWRLAAPGAASTARQRVLRSAMTLPQLCAPRLLRLLRAPRHLAAHLLQERRLLQPEPLQISRRCGTRGSRGAHGGLRRGGLGCAGHPGAAPRPAPPARRAARRSSRRSRPSRAPRASPRRARTAGAWPRRAARPSVLSARAGPSPPWAPRGSSLRG